MISRRFWLFFALVLPLYLTWTFDHSLWNPDETRDAGIAAEMTRSQRYAVPRLNGEAFLEKPPLYYWTAAVIYKLTGTISAGTTRLPSALYGLLGIVFTYLIGTYLFNERVGFFSAAMLATSIQYFRMSHFALMDVALAALVTGSFYFYLKGNKWGFILLAIGAFYAKGFLGLVLPGGVILVESIVERKKKNLMGILALGSFLFAVLVGPWFWLLWKEGGLNYLSIFFIDNHWDRFFSGSADHAEHFWFFYFLSFPADFLPWTFVYLGHVWNLVREPQRYMESKPLRFLLIWLFSLLLFFSASSGKRSIYLLPLFPAASLLSAYWLDVVMKKSASGLKWERVGQTIFVSLVIFIGGSSFFLAPKLDQDKTFVPICQALDNTSTDGTVIGYNLSEMERGVFGFYLKRLLVNPKNPEELKNLLARADVKSFSLVVNRNKIDEIKDVLRGQAHLVLEYRPHERTRSYLVYGAKKS